MSFYRPGGIGTGSATTVPYQISEGGTGATNAADARTNLGVTATGQDSSYAKTANNLSDLANAATARSNLGLATVANTGSYNDLINTPVVPSSINDLGDVTITSAASGQILTYISGSWVNASSVADGVLTFNGRDGAVTLTSADVNNAVGDTVLTSGDVGVVVQGYDPDILVSGDIGVLVEAYDPSILKSADIGVKVQAYDPDILVSSDIGVTIQAYDPDILVSGDIGVLVQAYDPNILVSSDIGVLVEAYNPDILVSGDIGVLVEAYDPSILRSADIGVKVQAYDPDILVSGDIGVTIQPYDATILNASAIGSTVQAYDSNLTSFVGTFTLPTTDGTANQVLKTDGAGNIGFASAAAAGVSSFNTRTGAITLTSGDVTSALGYTPLASADIGVSLQAYDSNLTNFVSVFTLPSADGTNGQFLTTNGSGTLSFASASAGGGITTGKAIAMAIVFGG